MVHIRRLDNQDLLLFQRRVGRVRQGLGLPQELPHLPFRLQGSIFRVWGSGCVSRFGVRVQVQGSEFRDESMCLFNVRNT